mmetsp:Transcript_7585/g.15221  ORF Transcript_7585/g.15221 Transcript_7585/m.15221 type:complete len:267 (+) Transcript_7585:30-830(+)
MGKQGKQKKRTRDAEEEDETLHAASNESDTIDTTSTSTSSSEEEDDDDSEGAFDTIDVDFEFFDPDQSDFHGIKTLLTNYLDGKEYNCSDFVDEVMGSQGSTVIKCGDGENVIGIAAVVDIGTSSLFGVLDFIEGKCPEDMLPALKELKNAKFIVSERLMNSPPQLAPPLMDAIFDGREDGTEHYILLGRAYKDNSTPSSKGFKLIFALPEYQFLYDASRIKFEFEVAAGGHYAREKDDLRPMRFVCCIDRTSLNTALGAMKKVIQ